MGIDRRAVAVLAKPRVTHLLTAALVNTVTSGAMPLALLVTLASRYGFTIAGLVDGAYTLLLAGLSPLRARLLDRVGQRSLLPAMGAVSATMMVLITVCVAQDWPWPVALTLIIASGMSAPPLSAALRVSWRSAVTGPDELKVVHSADSVIEELGFVLGPAIAGVGFALFTPQTVYDLTVGGSVVALLIYLAAAWRYHLGDRQNAELQDTAYPNDTATGPRTRPRRWLGPLGEPAMVPILAPLLVMGLMFGGLGVFVPAYTQHLGQLAWSGPIIALISVGGIVGGLIYGVVKSDANLWQSYRFLATSFTLPCCALAFASPLWLLAILLTLAGLSVTPLFSNAYLLVDSVVSPGTRHEANAWVSASTDLANGVSAIVIGSLVGHARWQAALMTLGATALACLILVRLWRTSHIAPAGSELGATT